MKGVIVMMLALVSGMLTAQAHVKVGAEVLIERELGLLKGKRVGVITNHTGRLPDGTHIVDALLARGIRVTALFGPEHGIRGDAPDGESVSHGTDARTGIAVYSLYGKIVKPTPEMLADVDVLLYDIQDVGVRFYTYISTMALSMEAAAEQGKEFILLDRPNPIRGIDWDGPIRDDSLASFVSLNPIPVSYGMTLGELAAMVNGEGWLSNGVKAKLTVIPLEGWRRTMWFDKTGLPFVKPSPNLTTLDAVMLYPGVCFIEGTNVSEGRGTERPFEQIGAPWIDSKKLADYLNGRHIPGVKFAPLTYTPVDIARMTADPKYEGKECRGIAIKITNRERLHPVRMGIEILCALKKLFPGDFSWRESRSGGSPYIDKLTGSQLVRTMIDAGKAPEEIYLLFDAAKEKFGSARAKYLRY
jgi:uncharacterized protein YbbC (DUF1343 family)